MKKFSEILVCPKCGENLVTGENSLVCKNNHCYDIAKEGYVNLLLANMKKTKMPGDDKLMVQARKTFLDKDYYGRLKTEINKVILDYQPKILLDAGCGTGYYSNNLGDDIEVIGVDISKFAIMSASKNNKNGNYVVASIFDLPLKNESVDAILNVFAPKPQNEFKRVLKPNAIIIEVVPGGQHLKELKQAIFENNYKENAEKFAFDSFKLLNSRRVQYVEAIKDKNDFTELLQMTPYWYKGGEKNLNLLNNANLEKITLDFIINIWG